MFDWIIDYFYFLHAYSKQEGKHITFITYFEIKKLVEGQTMFKVNAKYTPMHKRQTNSQ